jgi:EAL domain-containing protein (putative c-di-GMP-specific phosphodiesterase class I)
MTITAEGVETSDQMSLVREQGCTDVQGYYICCPVPAMEAERMVNCGRTHEDHGDLKATA